MEYKVSLSMPCWGRPVRTQRAIENILSQDMIGWEALVIGDGCPSFQNMIDSGWLDKAKQEATSKGNSLIYDNPPHTGGCGYAITNSNILRAQGEYLLFMGNDDAILPTHFSHYYSYIKESNLDYMWFNTFLHPINQIRNSKLAPSEIGHSELICRTSMAKKAPPHENKYGHDWDFFRFFMEHGKGAKATSPDTTYHVMSIPGIGSRDKFD